MAEQGDSELPKRTVKFPTDLSIGSLYVHQSGTAAFQLPSWWSFARTPYHFQGVTPRSAPAYRYYWKQLGNTQDNVEVPADYELALVAHEESHNHYDSLAKLLPNDLQGLRATFMHRGDLRFIANLTGLRYLFLASEELSDNELVGLEGLSELQILMLIGCRNVNTGLSALRDLTKLRQLELNAVDVTDRALVDLAQIPSLDLLIFNEMGMSEDAFITYLTPLPVPRLFLGNCYNLTVATLERIAQTYHGAPRPLVEFRVYDNTLMNGEDIKFFLKSVPKGQIEIFGIPGMPVTKDTLKQIEGLTGLVELDLGSTQITDAGVEHLESLSKMQHLHLGNTHITDKSVERLAQLKGLQTLVVEGTRISQV